MATTATTDKPVEDLEKYLRAGVRQIDKPVISEGRGKACVIREFSIKEWVCADCRVYVIVEWEVMKDDVKRAHAFAEDC